VGFVAGAIALLPVAWLIVRGLRGADAGTRRWAWAAAFVLVYPGLSQVLDFTMNVSTAMLAAAVPVAILDASSERRLGLGSVTVPHAAMAARAVLWGACLVAVLVLARTESLAWRHEQAVDAVLNGDWDVARGPADDAAAQDPDMPPYQVTRGLVASAHEDWGAAAEAFGRAARTDDLPQSWLGLAQAQLESGATADEVATSIARATRIGEQQPAVLYAAGALYDRLGRTHEADHAYAGAVAALPSLAGDPSWAADAALAARLPDILAQAAAAAPERAWEVGLMAGDAATARSRIGLAGIGPDVAELVIAAWEGDAPARARLFAEADDHPTDAQLLSWAARLADRAADDARAERYQRLAVYVVTERGEAPGTEIRVDRGDDLRLMAAGTITRYAGLYLYRRPLPPDLLAPGLPRLVHVERIPGRAVG
jgi:hypothetical protein